MKNIAKTAEDLFDCIEFLRFETLPEILEENAIPLTLKDVHETLNRMYQRYNATFSRRVKQNNLKGCKQ